MAMMAAGSVKIDRAGDEFSVAFAYASELVEVMRGLKCRRRFDMRQRRWLVEGTTAAYHEMRDAFQRAGATVNGMCKVADGLTDRVADAAIPTKLPLFDFQAEGVRFIERMNGRALLADEMGVGKSAQIIGYLAAHPEARPALVIAPASIRIQWVREVEKFSDMTAAILAKPSACKALAFTTGIEASGILSPGRDVVVTNYECIADQRDKSGSVKRAGLAMRIAEHGFQTIVLDEATAIKTFRAARTRAILRLCRRAPRVIIATGTPIMNRPKELFTLLEAVKPDLFPDWMAFARRYCNAHKKRILVRPYKDKRTGEMKRGGLREVWDFNGASNLSELNGILCERVMIRRRKEEVLDQLPDRRRVVIALWPEGVLMVEGPEMGKLREMLAKREEFKATLAGLTPDEAKLLIQDKASEEAGQARLTNVIFGTMAKICRDTAMAKVPMAVERIGAMAEEAGKVIVFAHHHDVIDALVEKLRAGDLGTVAKVDGRDGGSERQAAIDAFQGDAEIKVIVLGITAASLGLNLTAASNVVFAELPLRPADVDQAEARAWRHGQTGAVTSWFLVTVGTIEESLARVLDAKRGIVNAVLGEDERMLQEDGILDALAKEILKGQ